MINLSHYLDKKFKTIWHEFIIDLYQNQSIEISDEISVPDFSAQKYLEQYIEQVSNAWLITNNSQKSKKNEVERKFHYTINLPQIGFNIGKKYKVNFPWSNMVAFTTKFVNYVNSNIKDEDISYVTNNGNGGVDIIFKLSFIMQHIYDLSEKSFQLESSNPETIVVDFSSPNMAKVMHLGHLRSTIIGDVLCRFFEFMGHKVHRINHLGDWGRPFAIVIAYILVNKLEYETAEQLQDYYVKGTILFKENHIFENQVYDVLKKLQDKEPEIYKYWQDICRISRQAIQKVYDELNIEIEDIGESFYQDQMEKMITKLDDNKYLQEHKGMKVIGVEDIPNVLIMKKSDGKGGNYTYDTSDMAALQYRINKMKANRIYYVVDTGQSNHFELLLGAGKNVKFYNPEKHIIKHINFGLVQSPSGNKLSTRLGNNIGLQDILEMGKNLAIEDSRKNNELRQDNKLSEDDIIEMSTKLSNNCIKYFELTHKRTSNYKIDYNKIFSKKGNTAIYINYAYARFWQIWYKFRALYPDLDIDEVAKLSQNEIKIDRYYPENIEINIMLHILKFPEIIHLMEFGTTQNNMLMPHCFTDYVYELAQLCCKFYQNPLCYCLSNIDNDKPVVNYYSRMLMVVMTLKVMKTTLDILGIETLDKI